MQLFKNLIIFCMRSHRIIIPFHGRVNSTPDGALRGRYSISMIRFLLSLCLGCAAVRAQTAIHTWELRQIELRSSGKYANPYRDVDCWVDLKGPGFSMRIHGF